MGLISEEKESASINALRQLATYTTFFLALLAVAFSNGWHLPVIQGIGWVQMYHSYRDLMPAAEAIEIVVGGEQPCTLCKYVQNSNPVQENDWSNWQVHKLNLILSIDCTDLFSPPTGETHTSSYFYYPAIYFEEKESPPPKHLLS